MLKRLFKDWECLVGKISMRAPKRLTALAIILAPFAAAQAQAEVLCSTLEASLRATADQTIADQHAQVLYCLSLYPDGNECGSELTATIQAKYVETTTGSSQRRISYDYYMPPSQGGAYAGSTTNWSSCGPIVPVIDIDKNKEKPDADLCIANPIYPMTGIKRETIPLGLVVGSQSLTLTYDSSGKETGKLWLSSFHRSLEVKDHLLNINADRGNGRVVNFELKNGFYSAGVGVNDTLVTSTGGYIFTDAIAKTVENYDSAGQIIGLADAHGNTLSYTYSDASTPANIAPASGYLIKVSDQVGRHVKFEYALAGVTRVVDNGGQAIALSYNESGNLSSLTWADFKTKTFLYETVNFPWALTGIIDENNSRFATWAYNATGQAISSQHAGGVDLYTVNYGNTPPVEAVRDIFDSAANVIYRYREVTHANGSFLINKPNGSSSTASMDFSMGYPQLAGTSNPSGSGCADSNNATTFDGNGKVASQDDFQGMRTCFARDASGREVARVTGLTNTVVCSTVLPAAATLPVGARRITTKWHSDWLTPVVVTAPGSISTSVYQGQPDPFNGNAKANCSATPALPNGKLPELMCKMVVQATSLSTGAVDVTVPSVVSSFTYDTSGRILTSTDTAGRTTTYTYYADSVMDGQPVFQPTVSLLLHGDGTNGSASIVDSGSSPKGVTAVGNTKISTALSKFGGASVAFDGSTGYLVVPASQDFNFGAGDFTIEMWVYKTANNGNFSRLWNGNGDVYDGISSYIDPSGNWGVLLSTYNGRWDFNTPIANLANNQWYHLAITRSGSSVTAFVNGAPMVITNTLGNTPLYIHPGERVIGGQAGTPRMFSGYIDEFRITKGQSLYAGAFTPPTAAFADPWSTGASNGHLAGDLQSITGPTGFKTTFDSYDILGRIKQMTDLKGIVTQVTYTPRGWVTSVRTTAPGQTPRLTSYSYDGVGQLTGVANPDGTTLSYRYDAAHRLIGVTDAQGNTVSYTLDNVGNKIDEQIKDPSGVLQRSIGRSFDALNRLQQISGAPQ